jgi:prophage tail gpP-like protein
MYKISFVFVVVATLPLFAHAGDIYKWTDANGRVHYSQTPGEAGAATVDVGSPSTTAPSHAKTCVTWECYAQQLERDRRVREREYRERDAEQTRIEQEAKRRSAEAASRAKRELCKEFPRSAECRPDGARERVQRVVKKR